MSAWVINLELLGGAMNAEMFQPFFVHTASNQTP
jgi:hypothetical protein